VPSWTYYWGSDFDYQDYLKLYQYEDSNLYRVDEYVFLNVETEEPYWNPFRPPFNAEYVSLETPPINPALGEPYWNYVWEVQPLKLKEWLNAYRIAYDVANNEFLWGPNEYPANGDGTYTYWDTKVIPVHADGKPYYAQDNENIIFINEEAYHQIKAG
jgi:hypothetical protein